MTYNSKVKHILKKNNGYITTALLENEKIPRVYLTRLVNEGLITRVNRGIYVLSTQLEDELYINALKYPKAIFSRGTALYLNNMSNQTLYEIEVNLPHEYNTHRIKTLKTYRVNEIIYNTGETMIKTSFGNQVRSYDKERCICELFLHDDFDNEQKKYAIDAYVKEGIHYEKLYKYAKTLKIYEQIKQLFEVL